MFEIFLYSFAIIFLLTLVLTLQEESWERFNSMISFFFFISVGFLFTGFYWLGVVDNFYILCLNSFQYPYNMNKGHISMRTGLTWLADVWNPNQTAFLLSGGITSIIFLCLITTKPSKILKSASVCLLIILGSGFNFITTDSLAVMLVCFELLLLTSLYLLRLTSKSERVVDAASEMFFWTLVGSLALLVVVSWALSQGLYSFSLILETTTLPPIFLLLIFIGFGVKVPVWPFVSWLLKAHVEASVEFSILLSGFIVKIGVYGIYKILQLCGGSFLTSLFVGFCFLGLVMATFRLFAQRDLKRIVALTTVIEMNWLGMCFGVGGVVFEQVAIFLVVAHSITTSLEFFLIECISKRFNSRDLTLVSGLFFSNPLLASFSFFIILITIGFPGTPLFVAKLIFFSALVSLSFGFFLILAFVLLLVIPLFFIKTWAPIWFGLSKQTSVANLDLNSGEVFIFLSLLFFALILSIYPGIILFI